MNDSVEDERQYNWPKSLDSSLDEAVYDVLGVENAVAAFTSYGSTAPDEVTRQIQRWKKKLDSSQQTIKS